MEEGLATIEVQDVTGGDAHSLKVGDQSISAPQGSEDPDRRNGMKVGTDPDFSMWGIGGRIRSKTVDRPVKASPHSTHLLRSAGGDLGPLLKQNNYKYAIRGESPPPPPTHLDPPLEQFVID